MQPDYRRMLSGPHCQAAVTHVQEEESNRLSEG